MVDYLRDHKEDIDMQQFERIAAYIDTLDPIIMRNEARQFQNEQIDQMRQMGTMPDGATPEQLPDQTQLLNQEPPMATYKVKRERRRKNNNRKKTNFSFLSFVSKTSKHTSKTQTN